jgi:hypothetical protein
VEDQSNIRDLISIELLRRSQSISPLFMLAIRVSRTASDTEKNFAVALGLDQIPNPRRSSSGKASRMWATSAG